MAGYALDYVHEEDAGASLAALASALSLPPRASVGTGHTWTLAQVARFLAVPLPVAPSDGSKVPLAVAPNAAWPPRPLPHGISEYVRLSSFCVAQGFHNGFIVREPQAADTVRLGDGNDNRLNFDSLLVWQHDFRPSRAAPPSSDSQQLFYKRQRSSAAGIKVECRVWQKIGQKRQNVAQTCVNTACY